VRFAQTSLTHPRVLDSSDSMPGSMAITFLVSLLAMTVLFITLCKYELASKHASIKLRGLRRRLAGDEELLTLPRSAAPQEL
jgi:heme exporter protein C